MLPPPQDVRWQNFLTKMAILPFTGLSTKMMVSRLKIKLILDDSDASKQEAISEAHSFFASNEAMVSTDLALIFG